MVVTIFASLLEDVLLNVFKQLLYIFYDSLYRTSLLFESITTHNFDCSLFEVATAHNQTYRHTLELIVCKLEAWTLVVCIIELNANAKATQFANDRVELLRNSANLLRLADRNYDYLDRSEVWRKYKSVIV